MPKNRPVGQPRHARAQPKDQHRPEASPGAQSIRSVHARVPNKLQPQVRNPGAAGHRHRGSARSSLPGGKAQVVLA